MNTQRIARPAWHVLALTLVAGIIAGCGSGSSPEAGPSRSPSTTVAGSPAPATQPAEKAENEKPGGDACDIVSDEVVAEVLGVAVVRREPHGTPAGQAMSCIKGLARTSDPKLFTYVNASVMSGAAAAADKAGAQPGSKPISGLGDRALFLPNAGALYVIDGPDLVEVQVVKAGVPGNQQACVAVAKDVLSNRG